MELTRKQVIKNLNALNAVCGQKDFYDKEMEESIRYAISSLKTDEAYQIMYEGGEIFTKADMVAMLYKLRSEIINMPKYFPYTDHTRWFIDGDVFGFIDKEINALKGEENGKNT